MMDFIASVGVLVLGGAMLALASRNAERWERSILVMSFAMHVASALAQVWITRDYYGYGDMMTYFYNGTMLSNLLSYDFSTFAPEAVKLILHQTETRIPIEDVASGTASSAMVGIAGFLLLGLGNSLYALCILVAMASFGGKILLYRGLKEELPPEVSQAAMTASLLIPSAVFWSSGFLKESLATTALGVLFYATHQLLRHRTPLAAVMAAVGLLGIGLIKPYILFPFAIGVGAWVYSIRAGRMGRTLTLKLGPTVLAILLMLGAILLLGKLFPDYAVDRVAESTAQQQELGQKVEGSGSRYSLGVVEEKSLAGQLVLAPLALITALFRPFIFESKNILMFINSFETTAVTYLFLMAVLRGRYRQFIDRVLSTPILAFSVSMSLVFALAVGLASTNLGTLSRYRMPMLPFLFTVLLVERHFARAAPTTEEDAAITS